VNAWTFITQQSNPHIVSSTRLHGLEYSKGAEIFPPCNQKDFTLADSFPENTVPPSVVGILKDRGFDIENMVYTEDSQVKYGFGSRRNFLVGASGALVGGAVTAILSKQASEKLENISIFKAMSIPDAVNWIDQNCDRRFYHAVVSANYNFLYRGISVKSLQNSIHYERSEKDLLEIETYGTKEALEYFQTLEMVMEKDVVKPSIGDLATSSITEANKWGAAASIWPIKGSHYAWFQDKELFYPRSKRISRDELIVDGKDCGKDSLEDALRANNCEIMISAEGYLVVPVSFDSDLRDALKSSFIV
jgi:hypothetical protein